MPPSPTSSQNHTAGNVRPAAFLLHRDDRDAVTRRDGHLSPWAGDSSSAQLFEALSKIAHRLLCSCVSFIFCFPNEFDVVTPSAFAIISIPFDLFRHHLNPRNDADWLTARLCRLAHTEGLELHDCMVLTVKAETLLRENGSVFRYKSGSQTSVAAQYTRSGKVRGGSTIDFVLKGY